MNRKLEKTLVIALTFLSLAIALNIYGLTKSINVQLIINLLAIALEMVYFLDGYRKRSNKYFRTFMGFLAIKEAIALLNVSVVEKQPMIACIIILIGYSCILILAVAKDLGKKLSFILGYITVAAALVSFVAGIMMVPISTNEGLIIAIYNFTRVLLDLELLAMLLAKYKDKAERYSKLNK